MKTYLFILSCFAFIALFWPHTAEAQCSRGACGVVQRWAPFQGHVTTGILVERPVVTVLAAPVRIVAAIPQRAAARVQARVEARAEAAPTVTVRVVRPRTWLWFRARVVE